MNFYETSADDNAVVTANFDLTDWRRSSVRQILSAGLIPKHPYATADGLTKPDGSCYLYEPSDQVIMPLWSSQLCNSAKEFAENDRPIYTELFPANRKIGALRLIGDERWAQGPTEYELRLYVPLAEQDHVTDNPIQNVTGYSRIGPLSASRTSMTAEYKIFTFHAAVGSASPVRQYIALSKCYQVRKLELELLKWNAPGTTSKLMFLSTGLSAAFGNDSLSRIKVLEEKIENAQELSYGISSNYCEVSVSNEDGRFTANPDLLKKNRIVRPAIQCEGDAQWEPLGVFYSDEWQVSATSNYVSCKAYDVLYNLQKMKISYSLVFANGIYSVEKDRTAAQVFNKLNEIINAQRKANGIYGDDLEFVLDTRLSATNLPYVLLGEDTSWNMLKQLANVSRSFVYVSRDGKVHVDCDLPRPDFGAGAAVVIDEKNAFTYNLPTMSRMLANRVTVPYVTEAEGNADDDIFTVEREDFQHRDGCIFVKLEYKNFYDRTAGVIRYEDQSFMTPVSAGFKDVRYNCQSVEITFQPMSSEPQKLYLKLSRSSGTPKVLKTSNLIVENLESQAEHGVAEFTFDCGTLVYGEGLANSLGADICARYGGGKSFIDATWTGTPAAELSLLVKSRSGRSVDGDTYKMYETVGNEIILENGLRFTTKAREN